ncbi:alpha/beta hydrolase [Phreatobacter sp. AB_2022a]|uniref:alpha/beta hydrolase n=1 Tax=Phreatobacter sp. AB_2022a TaxID=3003134 RepID=UPI0022870169|nr:alpha/beta hydrolase [Phreatobacter sp. AB_2022a]MCZ0738057.1 alpha/beta hydrolase [Phreatobacter sp. AB_2022a]
MTSQAPLWSGLSAEEHEFQYNPQAAFPNYADAQAGRQAASAAARASLTCHADIAYGDHPLRKLDIYPAAQAGAPVHVFLHGGYWRAQDKQNFVFVARELVAAGITTVVVNYELCPASTLDGVAASAVAAVDWVRREIGAYGGDARRVSLSGHSAGAHLTAEVLAHDWAAAGVDPAFIVGAVLISGIYDPRPVMRTSVNAEVRLTEEIALRRDVERRPVVVRCPATIFVGGREPWQWIDMSYRYGHHLHRAGMNPEVHTLPRWGHFDILNEYLEPGSPILNAVIRHATRA